MNADPNYNSQWLTNQKATLPIGKISVADGKKGSLYSLLNKQLSGIQFLKYILVASLAGIGVTIGINASIDIYGLFLPVKGKELPIYNNERVSKYLLSYRYIPQNFNTAIVGTSLSANLDVGPYNEQSGQYRIYNASIMGANISELSPIVKNIINGGVDNIIICFSPYMTKNSGSKEVELNRKLYYGALGSKNLYETYLVACIRNLELMLDKFPKNQVDQYGVNHYENLFKVENVKEKIARVIMDNKEEQLNIDPVAMNELKTLIKLLNDHEINYSGYFHPVPKEVFESKQTEYQNFENEVRRTINDDRKLIDFNSPEYQWFTTNYNNYIDHAHLSNKGQETILNILLEKFR